MMPADDTMSNPPFALLSLYDYPDLHWFDLNSTNLIMIIPGATQRTVFRSSCINGKTKLTLFRYYYINDWGELDHVG